MPKKYKGNVLTLYNTTEDSYTYSEMCDKLDLITREDMEKLTDDIVDYVDIGYMRKERDNYYLDPNKVCIGNISINSNGDGFITHEDYCIDIFVSRYRLNKAFHKDKVIVSYEGDRRGRRDKYEGNVESVLERYQKNYIGIQRSNKKGTYIETKRGRMYSDINVISSDVDTKDGDLVLVEMIGWSNKKMPNGKITALIGKPHSNDLEIHAILAEYNLPHHFTDDVEEDANSLNIGITDEEIAKRVDYRDVLTFTIDPSSAKDFDDALSYKALDNGNIEVGVHIADVSHYVKPGTKLDEEAYNRSTSIYLVDRVVPMLPEVLSNFACSLRPNEDKYTFSFIFEINEGGQIIKESFNKGLINSDYRYSYEEAQYIIENGDIKQDNITIPIELSLGDKETIAPNNVIEAILNMDMIAKKFRNKRIKSGATIFDKSEVRFELSRDGNPVGIFETVSKDSNKLIEEFMLLANRRSSEYITKMKKPFIYRVHGEPSPERLQLLQENVTKFGYNINLGNNKRENSKALNKLLVEVSGKVEQNFIDMMVIKSMSKAEYSSEDIGHYGLAFDHYSHMTSPIRRYSDIIGHRLLDAYLNNRTLDSKNDIEIKTKHINNMEKLAISAERDSIKYMQVLYMSERKNMIFEGVVTGVTRWGIFVELVDNKCEGMIKTNQSEFSFDEKTYSTFSHWTGEMIQLGDKVMVKCDSTDLNKKQINFSLHL